MLTLTSATTDLAHRPMTAIASGSAQGLHAPQQGKPSIADQNSAVAQYNQTADGLVHVRLYNSPAAIAGDAASGGWRLRGTHLVATVDGGYAPADTPFKLHIAADTPNAMLTGEDGDALHVAPAAQPGQAATHGAGQVADNALTFPALTPAALGDLSFRATPAGLDVRLLLHNSGESGQLQLALTTDQSLHDTLVSQTDGRIRVAHQVQDCGSQGCRTTTEPSFIIDRPIVRDSNADAAAALFSGAATLQSTGSDAAPQLTLTVNSTWLHDPARTFPVTVDVPILTIAAAAQTGGYCSAPSRQASRSVTPA